MTDSNVLAIYFPGGIEWAVILVVALLIFGKRLPDVAKGVGRSIVEFKKGLNSAKDEMREVASEVDEAVEASEQRQLEAEAIDTAHLEARVEAATPPA